MHPIIAPKIPGIACKLFTPQVSCKPIFSYKNLDITLNPYDEKHPPINPIKIEKTDSTTKSELDPITTPPAKVAFKTSSILNFP